MSNPKIKYSKQRNGEIFYPRTVAEAIRFNDGESLETKMNKDDSAKNYPIASELEAREGVSNDVLMTPLRTLQLLEENGMNSGGGGITIPVLSSEYNQTSVDTGTSISIPITFYSPNLGKGTLHLLVDGVEVSNTQIAQGSSYAEFGVLEKGNHRLSIFVVDRGGIYTDTLSFNIKVGALDISSTFDDSTDFTITQVIKIPLTVDTISLDPVYATYTIDGTATRISVGTGYNVIQLPILSSGAHKVVITAESGVYKSNTLSFNIIIEDADNLVVISDFNTTEITYRNLMELSYRVSLKGVSKFVAKYYDNDTLLKTLNIPAGTNIWSTRELEIGAHTLKVVVTTEDGSMSAELIKELTVIESDYKPMTSVVDASLIAWFDATGKTNNDIDRDTWTDKSSATVHPTAELYNLNYGSNGWIDNALKLNGGAYAVINLQALKDNASGDGLTVDIKYRTRDVGHQDACVLDMRGSDSNGKGFAIDTERIYLNSASSKINSDVVQEEISRATFVIDRPNKIAKIYNNGVLTETFLMTDTEDFYNTTKIYLGTTLDTIDGVWQPSLFGDCEVYSIRVYTRALESEEIVKNYIADTVDLVEQQEKYELNYQNNMPTMYFYGDTSAMTKDSKVPLRIKYISTDPSKYGESFDLVDCLVSWQGTSSLQYAVKNYKIRLKRQDGSKFKYNPYPKGIEESTFCLKADYMESSHANNTGMAKFINDQLYDTPTPPQANNEDVRTTINGFPIQLYIAKNENVEPTYIGIFNFNLDKSCNSSFGLNNEVEGFENCARFEVSSNSDTSAGAFRDDSDESMREDFELNYPDPDDITTEQQDSYYNSLKRVVTWVKNSTEETFKAELEQYFNKEYLIKYFLQVHLLGMIDNFGKNMMLVTWDGNIWYPMFYDLDSQLGLDNTGYKKFMSDIDIVEGVYNTSNSKLFTMLQACFADEIAETYKTLRRTGKYSMTTILSYWYGEQVAKIGELQYNKDMEAKYIAFKNDYLFMLHGRRYEHMKKWLSERMLYLDTIYGYEEDTSASITIRANTLNTITFKILTYSPQYLKVKWRNGVEQVLKVGRNASGNMTPATFSGTVATSTDQEIIIYNAKQIKTIEGLASANPSVLNLVEASRLVKLECKNSKVLTDVRLNSNNAFLSYIDLSGCTKLGDEASGGTTSIDLSDISNLEYVNLDSTVLSSVEFPKTGCNLVTCYLPKTVKSVHLENMPMLQYVYGLGSGESNWSGPRIRDNLVSKSKIIIKNCPLLRIKPMGHISAEYIHLENTFNNPDEEKISDYWCINPTWYGGGGLGFIWVNVTYLYLKDLHCFNNCSLIIATSTKDTLEEPTLTFDIVNCDIKDLVISKLGFSESREVLDLSSNRLGRVCINSCSNVKKINFPSNLTGLSIVNKVGIGWTLYKYSNPADPVSFTPYENALVGTTFTINGESPVKNNVLDLSSLSIIESLCLEDIIVSNMGESIDTIKINCDFSKGTGLSMQRDGGRFFLPVSVYVEGYLKSVNTARLWCSCTDSVYTPMENFEKLEWDLSEVIDISSMFENWKMLTKLPDCITPELINRCTRYVKVFRNCTSLTDLNKLEGADLTIRLTEPYWNECTKEMFCNVKGPFTLSNINLLIDCYYTNIVINCSDMFIRSGLTSIGDITVTNETGQKVNYSGMFRQCANLKSIGNVNIIYSTSYSYLFSGCPLLETIGEVHLGNECTNDYDSLFLDTSLKDDMLPKIFLPEGASLPSTFSNTKITDLTKLNNYYNVIKKALSLNKTFYKSQLTFVPDLDIDDSASCTAMFSSCRKIETVGSIVYKGTGSCNGMFDSCEILTTVEKLDIKNSSNVGSLFCRDVNLQRVGYLDISSATSANMMLYIYRNHYSQPLYLGFEGFIKKDVVNKDNFLITFNGVIANLTLETWQKFIECIESCTTATTLKVGATNFALFTEEMLATMSAKNWTVAA